jgi:WD40 repeat protein
MKRLALVLCLIAAAPTATAQELQVHKVAVKTYREWTGAGGGSLGECAVEEYRSSPFNNQLYLFSLKLKPRSGRSFEVKLAELSTEDQAVARRHWEQILVADARKDFPTKHKAERVAIEKELLKAEKDRQSFESSRKKAANALLAAAEEIPPSVGTTNLCGAAPAAELTTDVIVASPGTSGTAAKYDMAGGLAHAGVVSSIVLSLDGTLAATASGSNLDQAADARGPYPIKVWSLAEGTLLHECEGHDTPTRSLALGAKGTRLASSSIEGEIRLWSFPDLKLLAVLKPSVTEATEPSRRLGYQAIGVAEEASLLVCVHSHGFMRWKLSDGTLVDEFKVQAWSPRNILNLVPYAMKVSADGKRVAVGGAVVMEDGYGYERITQWSLPDGELLQSIDQPRLISPSRNLSEGPVYLSNHILCLDATRDWRTVVAGTEDGIYVYDLTDGRFLWRIKTDEAGKVFAVAITPDGSRIIAANDRGEVQVWSLEEGKLLKTLRGPNAAMTSLAITPDAGTVVTGNWLGSTMTWCLKKYEFVRYVIDEKISIDTKQYVIIYRDRKTLEPKIATNMNEIPISATEVHWIVKTIADEVLNSYRFDQAAAAGGTVFSSNSGSTYTYTYSYTVRVK